MMMMLTFAIMSFPFSVYFPAAADSLACVLFGADKFPHWLNVAQIYSAEQPILNSASWRIPKKSWKQGEKWKTTFVVWGCSSLTE